MKAEDFITLLRESQYFTENQIDAIATDCRSHTIGQVLHVCRKLEIGLNGDAITDLVKRFINS